MATSSSINFTLTSRQIIEYALRKINILAQGVSADGDDAETARVELNMMLKDWMKYEHLWRRSEGSITLAADTSSYTSLTDSSVAYTPRPYRIYDCRYRNSSSIDTPMTELTREEYFELPQKSSGGVPTQFYFDFQRDSWTFYVWPVPETVTTETIQVTYQKFFEDVDTLNENVDIAPQYLALTGYNLAARLADDYGRVGPQVDRVIMRAEQMLQEMLDDDRENHFQFMPDERYYNGG